MDGLPTTIRLIDPPLHEFLPDLTELAVKVAVATEPDPTDVALLAAVDAPLRALGRDADPRVLYLLVYCALGLWLGRWSLRERGHLGVALAVCLNPLLLPYLWQGANDILLVAGMAVAAVALTSRRVVLAGLALGAAMSVKLLIAPMVVLFVVWLAAEARRGRLDRGRAWWAAAATMAGLISSVRPVGLPCRPLKFRLEDDALISRPCSLSGFMPRHIEQPAPRHSAPAAMNTWSRPSASAWSRTRTDPGTTRRRVSAATVRPSRIEAARRRSSIRPLVQEPTKTVSTLTSRSGVPAVRPM